jgi:magnesium transporter
LEGVAAALREGERCFFANMQAPTREELEKLRKEFGFHPLAIEDVLTRHQRPKIDVYPDHYFLVVYRIGADTGEDVLLQELDFFIGHNFLVVTHDSEVPCLDEVFERFRRAPEKKSVSRLLYEILDAIVDEYFPFVDAIAERTGEIEEAIFHGFETEELEKVLALKRDLALLRRVVGPERDTINVLLRRDPPIIEPGEVFYFQDVYDHLVRVTDSIDTYRELLSGSLEAFLSIQNNRLSEVVKRLTVISVIFLPLTFLTGFFGMNFERTTGTGDMAFALALGLMVVVPLGMYLFLRRKAIQ